MADLFSVCIHFNGGNPQLFKVQYINVTLKAPKDNLNEINQRLNPKDTWRVEYTGYKGPTLDGGRISFSRLELMNDDEVRNMFSICWQYNMFPLIDMYVALMRSPVDILNNLIMPELEDYV